MQILAATDFSTRSQRAVRRAGLLAQSTGADLALVHVVDDDQPRDLVEIERREAERILAEQIKVMAELPSDQCRPMVAVGDPFDGILRAAAATSADIIVMGAHRKQLLRDIFVGTTIERVIRKGPYPVLMVNNEARQPYGSAVAAVDMSAPSANAVRAAESTDLVGNGRITLIHAFGALGKMSVAGLEHASVDEFVASERKRAMSELVAFLDASNLADHRWSLRVEEGAAFKVISDVVEEMRPDLLIVGTHGRSGIIKVLLGSVTEEALRSLDVDILAVPPIR